MDAPTQAAHILLNGVDPTQEQNELTKLPSAEGMDQSASFFDPKNSKAAQLREQVAMSTLDELLDFLLNQGGSVGILDATNSTVERRQVLFNRVKEREPKLGIIFIESVCQDQKVCFNPFLCWSHTNDRIVAGGKYATKASWPRLQRQGSRECSCGFQEAS
jgi:6-phosphofructo-2-kinase